MKPERSEDFLRYQEKLSKKLAKLDVEPAYSSKRFRESMRDYSKTKEAAVQTYLGKAWIEGRVRFHVESMTRIPLRVTNTEALGQLTKETMGYVGRMHSGVANSIIKEIEKGIREGLPHAVVKENVALKLKEIADGEQITIRTLTGKTYKTSVENYANLLTKQNTNVAYDRGHSEAARDSGIVEKTAYRICFFGPNTCEECVSAHGEEIGIDEDITLHPNCQCTKGFRFTQESAVPQLYNEIDLQLEKEQWLLARE